MDNAQNKMLRHVRRPTELERARRCSVCQKSFMNLLHFNIHKLTHTHVECDRCGRLFSRFSGLAVHTRIKHIRG